jgi:predicted ribosome quality control (RQC) complex YloA/Tae2 family protein
MRISHDSYEKYINSLNRQLSGKILNSPILLNNKCFMFPFDGEIGSLIISFNHASPCVFKKEEQPFFSSMENPFVLRLRKKIRKSLINCISLAHDDNIVCLSLHVIDEIEEGDLLLYIELIPMHPNLILCDKNKTVIEAYYQSKNRELKFGDTYTSPKQTGLTDSGEQFSEALIDNLLREEIENRRKERYKVFLNFINGKIKQSKRKIMAIEDDIKLAQNNINYASTADEILCLGLNLKSRLESAQINGRTIKLDPSKTIIENVEAFYKRSKKAKETIARSESNIANANKEIELYESLLTRFANADEKSADKLMQEVGMIKKKKEVKATAFNKPYKLNLNGTIIYFGRNASQNDYLSFVMKLDREYTWLHIKDKSGAHLVICNKKPTDAELTFACEISLICSHVTSGEVIVATKKNVRRGHVLGEAILKNYKIIKLNNVSKETKDAFLKAEKVN